MSVITAKEVSKSFGSAQVLSNVTFEVPKGEVVVIIGRSGSGKSTLLRCLNGLETIDGGELDVLGYKFPMSTKKLREFRVEVGIVFQSYNLFPHMTVEENVMLAPQVVKKLDRAKARTLAQEVLEQVGLGEKSQAMPDQLSGGQQQRVAIARSLAMQPQLMLFDEVTSALDPELTSEVLRVIGQLAKHGMTMVLVTHEMEFAKRVANTVLFMHQSRIWESGSPDSLFDAPQTQELKQFLRAV